MIVLTLICACVCVCMDPKGPACVTLQEGHCQGAPAVCTSGTLQCKKRKLCTLTCNDRYFQCSGPKQTLSSHRKLKDFTLTKVIDWWCTPFHCGPKTTSWLSHRFVIFNLNHHRPVCYEWILCLLQMTEWREEESVSWNIRAKHVSFTKMKESRWRSHLLHLRIYFPLELTVNICYILH